MGEQDLQKELTYVQEEGKMPLVSNPQYSGTLVCTSQRAKVYVINKEYFLALKASTDSHLLLLNQVKIKTKRNCGGDLREKAIKEKKQKKVDEREKESTTQMQPTRAAATIDQFARRMTQPNFLEDSVFDSALVEQSIQVPLIRVEKNNQHVPMNIAEAKSLGSRTKSPGETAGATRPSIQDQDYTSEMRPNFKALDRSLNTMNVSFEQKSIINSKYDTSIDSSRLGLLARGRANNTILHP